LRQRPHQPEAPRSGRRISYRSPVHHPRIGRCLAAARVGCGLRGVSAWPSLSGRIAERGSNHACGIGRCARYKKHPGRGRSRPNCKKSCGSLQRGGSACLASMRLSARQRRCGAFGRRCGRQTPGPAYRGTARKRQTRRFFRGRSWVAAIA
jgi:hypothetical protein